MSVEQSLVRIERKLDEMGSKEVSGVETWTLAGIAILAWLGTWAFLKFIGRKH